MLTSSEQPLRKREVLFREHTGREIYDVPAT